MLFGMSSSRSRSRAFRLSPVWLPLDEPVPRLSFCRGRSLLPVSRSCARGVVFGFALFAT
jgi:hypothetical protein